MYLYVRIYTRDALTEKRKQYPSQGDDASTAEAAPGASKVSHVEQTPHRTVDLISS